MSTLQEARDRLITSGLKVMVSERGGLDGLNAEEETANAVEIFDTAALEYVIALGAAAGANVTAITEVDGGADVSVDYDGG